MPMDVFKRRRWSRLSKFDAEDDVESVTFQEDSIETHFHDVDVSPVSTLLTPRASLLVYPVSHSVSDILASVSASWTNQPSTVLPQVFVVSDSNAYLGTVPLWLLGSVPPGATLGDISLIAPQWAVPDDASLAVLCRAFEEHSPVASRGTTTAAAAATTTTAAATSPFNLHLLAVPVLLTSSEAPVPSSEMQRSTADALLSPSSPCNAADHAGSSAGFTDIPLSGSAATPAGQRSAPPVGPALVGAVALTSLLEYQRYLEGSRCVAGGHAAGADECDLDVPVLTTAYRRLMWLVVSLLSTVLSTFVISEFGDAIAKLTALAYLMPICGAMGGNAGLQVLTVVTRGLGLGQMRSKDRARILTKEVLVGILNGTFFALIFGPAAWLWQDNPGLGFVVGVSLVLIFLWSGFGGTLMPILSDLLGLDPAVTCGPIFTTVTDVFGYLIFLGLASALLMPDSILPPEECNTELVKNCSRYFCAGA